MPFAQKNYLQPQGIPPTKYRINQIGCFLTSFCNLLERFGRPIDPVGLNAQFRDRGVYVDVDDGVRDDLWWTSVSQYDPQVVNTRIGNGAPTSNNSIVKLPLRAGVVHFCLVADAANHLIVDSTDGVLKNWAVYGQPLAFAEYELRVPKPEPVAPIVIQPAPKPSDGIKYEALASPQAVRVKKDGGTELWQLASAVDNWSDFKSEKHLDKGHIFTASAKATHPLGGTYYMSSDHAGGLEGGRPKFALGVNVADLEQAPAEEPVEEKVEVKVETSNYKDTFDDHFQVYRAIRNAVVKDMDGLDVDLQLRTKTEDGRPVNVRGQGTFVKDGVTYVRTVKSTKAGLWYGIPIDALKPVDDPDLFNLDLAKESKELLGNLTAKEKFIANVAKGEGFIFRLLAKVKLVKLNKKETK